MIITAYEYILSIKMLRKHVDEDSVFRNYYPSIVQDVYTRYAEEYFKANFFNKDDEFCPKESLNEYELQLFQHHIAFIETIEGTCYFMGYKLLK